MPDRDVPPVRVERLLPHPPKRVWRALTRPDAIGKWLLPVVAPHRDEADGAPPSPFRLDSPGRGLTLRSAPGQRIACEVAEAEPERRLVLSWRVAAPSDGPAEAELPTVVTWTLTPERDGAATRLVVEHGPARTVAMADASHLAGAAGRLAAYLDIVRPGVRQRRRAVRGSGGGIAVSRRATGRLERKIPCR